MICHFRLLVNTPPEKVCANPTKQELDDFERLEQQAARDAAVQRLATVNRSRAGSRVGSRASSRRSSWDGEQVPHCGAGLSLPNGYGRHDDARGDGGRPPRGEPPARRLANDYAHDAAYEPPEGDHAASGRDAPHEYESDEHGRGGGDRGGGNGRGGCGGVPEYAAGPPMRTYPDSGSRRSAASTLEQLAAPSPARESPTRPHAHTNGYSHMNGGGQVRLPSWLVRLTFESRAPHKVF